MKIISNYFVSNNSYSTNFNRLNSNKNKINFCGIDENSNKDSFVKTDNSYIADKIMSENDQLDLFTNSDEDIKIIDCKKDEDGRDIIEIMSDDEIYKFKGAYSDIHSREIYSRREKRSIYPIHLRKNSRYKKRSNTYLEWK